MISTLLRPGLWLMQRCQFGSKLALLALALLLPMVFLLVQIVWDGGNRVDATLSVWVGIGGTVLGLYLAAAFYVSYRESMDQVQQALDLMVAGDMRQKLTTRGHDELASMAGKVNKLGATISAMVANVRSNSAFVAHAGKSMAAGNRDLSDRTEQQAANLEQTAASVEELSSTVQDNSRTAQQANAQAARVRDVADEGASTMAQAIESVEAIQSSAKRMDEIVSVIDGLAFQTNILALNAAVEAARAGESGRGFAVVASEVRSLAQRSAASAKEIRHLIGSSSSQVDGSVQKIRAAGTNINQIVSGIREVAASMAQISTSSAEQSASLSEITTAVRQLDEITQRNAQMVERSVSHAVDLEGRASTLTESVALFRLQQGSAEEAVELVRQAAAYRRQCSSLDSFIRDVTDKSHGFFDRDMYVFVLDQQGHYLAFGGNTAKVGTRVQDIPGIRGQELMDDIFRQAAIEPGWVGDDIANPTTGIVQSKMSYVQDLEGLALGCGVYKNLVVT
ncbi:MAG: cache domain-containing protein [Rhodoferax sp.]|nr:cache domain-containing protein [Rhodoferax sp.]